MSAMAARSSVLAVAVVSGVACSYGVQATRFEPAMGPRGVSTTFVTSSGEKQSAELLEVRETGLLLGNEKSILFVLYTAMSSARFNGMALELRGRRPPNDHERGTLRLVSRFPQGLSPPLLRQLLEARGQSEPRQLP
jgi:hypothetical protein